MVLWRPIRPFRTNTQKRSPFYYRGLECKSWKSRNTWSNRQIWPWNTEWIRAKTNRVLPRKCTGHNKHPLPTTQEKTLYMDITRWSTPNSDVYIFLFTAICKASPDSYFAFLHFFSMGMVLIPVSCTMSWTSFHSSSGTLSIRSRPLNLFLTSTV